MGLIWPEIEQEDFMITTEKMEKIVINRFHETKTQTLGEMLRDGKVIAKTLELGWNDNKFQVSCIPTGTYTVVHRFTGKYGHHFELLGVPQRSKILIHHGNYHTDILGCILVGKAHIDINGDGLKDVTASKDKMKELVRLLPKKFTLQIS